MRRQGGGMAKMLRHITGKRNFDLYALPASEERLFTKDQLKKILSDVNSVNLSPENQSRLSTSDSPMHFYDIGLDVIFSTVSANGYRHERLEDAVLEVLSHRSDYAHDIAMQEWMRENLVHVKYDLACNGKLKLDELVPLDEPMLYSLGDFQSWTLRDILSTSGQPLVVLAGSWS